MRILCDMDGVVANIDEIWLAQYNAEYGDNLTVQGIRAFAIERFVKPECGVDIYKYVHRRGFYSEAPVYEGAKEAIDALMARGHEIIFVTKPIKTAARSIAEKLEWVESHFPSIGVDNVVFCQKKFLIRGDALIDDYQGNLVGFEGLPILMTQPWNEDIPQGRWARVLDWPDVISKIDAVTVGGPKWC